MAFAAGQALRQQGGNALQSEVQRVARETTLNISEGERCCVWRVKSAGTVCRHVLLHVPLSLLPVALSGAGNLALCKHLIHVHSPQWDPVSGVDQLKTAVGNVLQCANENKIKTVAFPSIASGS